jgi:hypothetical protein
MAREDTQLPKKREKTGGRAKGTPNKATTVGREVALRERSSYGAILGKNDQVRCDGTRASTWVASLERAGPLRYGALNDAQAFFCVQLPRSPQ